MASGVYNRFKVNLANKEIDWEADVIRVMLLDGTHAFDADNNVLTDINANEITGTAYVANGEILANAAVTQDDTNDLAKLDGDDVVWSTATFTANHAVIYDDTLASDDLIASIDFGGAKSVTAGDFTIAWNTNGIIRLT